MTRRQTLHTFLGVLLGAATLGGCSAKGREASTPAVNPVARVASPSERVAPAKAGTAWERQSSLVNLDCGGVGGQTGTYQGSLDRGRKLAALKRWADAVAAFTHALDERADDPIALSELSWALLQAGDAKAALLTARHAASLAVDSKLRAASHYNGARAAESLGDLESARAEYEASLALRENQGVRERLAKISKPTVRTLPPATTLKECQGKASVVAACECIRKAEGTSTAMCETEDPKGMEGQLVTVWDKSSESDSFVPGRRTILLVKRHGTWSPIQLVASSNYVDLAETPHATEASKIVKYEELPFRDGTLYWIQSENEYSEWSTGEQDVRGEAILTLCMVSNLGAGTTNCVQLSIGKWDYTIAPDRNGSDEKCQVRQAVSYRLTLGSSGTATIVLSGGVDSKSLVGRYEF